MSQHFSQFPFRNTIGPIADTDRFLIGVPDVLSPTGFSNYLMSWAEIRAAVGVGTPGIQGPVGLTIPVFDGEDGEPSYIPGIPGMDGAQGIQGIQGIPGIAGKDAIVIPGIDGEDGNEGMPIPGATGTQGLTGATGFTIPGIDGEDGAEGVPIPGNTGTRGSDAPLVWLPNINLDDYDFPPSDIPSSRIDRAQLNPDAKGWQFLGTATGAAVTVGPITWTGQFRQLMMRYHIAGYNGGTPVGRILIGSAAISTIARNNSYAISEGVTAPTTAAGATAVPGCPLAVTLSNIGRGGWIWIDGASGVAKEIIVDGRNVAVAVANIPTLFRAASFFDDLGTNLLIQRAQLTVYDTLIAIAASIQTFTAGTYLSVWGRNND